MAKGIRSKIKRQHRSEFRRTIGQDAANKNMSIVQAKLNECIQKGSMNSFERLSNTFNCEPLQPEVADNTKSDASTPTVDAMDTTMGGSPGKSPSKIPVKASNKTAASKRKYVFPNVAGQSGAKLARKQVSKANKRGQMRKGVRVVKSRTRVLKKKKNMCAF